MSKPQFTEAELEFSEPTTEAEWDEYYRIRYERLRKPLGLPPESVRDDPLEPSSVHRVIKVDGRVVAAAAALVLTAGSVNAYLSGATEMLRELTVAAAPRRPDSRHPRQPSAAASKPPASRPSRSPSRSWDTP